MLDFSKIFKQPFVAIATMDCREGIHLGRVEWICPCSDNGRLLFMFPSGGRDVELIEGGASKIGVNIIHGKKKTNKGFTKSPKNPLLLIEASFFGIYIPEYVFTPAADCYTHSFVTMRPEEQK